MINGFVVQKKKMSSVFTPDGKNISVTSCAVSPLVVTQIKTLEKDKYSVVQVAYGWKKTLNKAIASKLKKLKLEISPAHFKEFFIGNGTNLKIGDKIDINTVFNPGDSVNASAYTKGHGFAGVIKRYGFQRQPVSGGQSDRVRAPGSIGAQTPGKVLKGKKMPGHYGNVKKTVSGLKIFSLNPQAGEIQIIGSLPGHFNSWIVITKNHESTTL